MYEFDSHAAMQGQIRKLCRLREVLDALGHTYDDDIIYSCSHVLKKVSSVLSLISKDLPKKTKTKEKTEVQN